MSTMSFEELLYEEYEREKVIIDYSMKDVDNTVGIKILSKDGKKEFRAEGVFLMDDSVEIGGKKYNIQEFIKALNTSFDKKNNY